MSATPCLKRKCYSALEMNVILITTVIQYMKMVKVEDFERLCIFGQLMVWTRKSKEDKMLETTLNQILYKNQINTFNFFRNHGTIYIIE